MRIARNVLPQIKQQARKTTYATVGRYDAQNEDPPRDRHRDGGCRLLSDETRARRVEPVQVEQKTDQEDVGPVRQQREPVRDEFGEQGCREGQERHGGQERELEPGQIPVGAAEQVQLCLLAVPENPQGEETEEVRHEARAKTEERIPEVLLRANGAGIGHVDLEDDEGHGYSEDTIGEPRDPLETPARGRLVIGKAHGRDCNE